VLDTAANPASYVGYPIQALSLLHERANADAALKMVDEALDPYIFLREAFLQRRNYLINDGKSDLTADVLNDDPLIDDKADKTKADKVDSKMDLGTEDKGFKHASDHLTNTEKSLDGTNQVFKAASDKLDQLEK
jgi:phospholipid-binding lipoprotein MlaA